MKKSIGGKTLVFPAPVLIVGTYDQERRANAMAVAWAGICCSQPPCVAVSLRKATYSYGNIVSRQAFTVNIPSEKQIREADYFGIVSGRDENKLERTGMTSVDSDLVDAPYIAEFPMILECRVYKTVEIGLHTQFIGEILDIKVDESVIGENGNPDMDKLKPIAYEPLNRRYFGIGSLLAKAYSVGLEFGG
jgi:flavin reductase (DIM6/NTAB) family NADH-FMN oxidoreductase RutF